MTKMADAPGMNYYLFKIYSGNVEAKNDLSLLFIFTLEKE
jgi:hypothetical protein